MSKKQLLNKSMEKLMNDDLKLAEFIKKCEEVGKVNKADRGVILDGLNIEVDTETLEITVSKA